MSNNKNKRFTWLVTIIILLNTVCTIGFFYAMTAMDEKIDFLYKWNWVQKLRNDIQDERIQLRRMIDTFDKTSLVNNTDKETRIKIAVIDTGVKITDDIKPYICLNGNFNYTTERDQDKFHPHGTHVTHIISKFINPKTHCIINFKVYVTGNNVSYMYVFPTLIKQILELQIKYVNISMGGKGWYKEEYNGLVKLLNNGVILTISAGNEGRNLDNRCDYYPACYRAELKNHPYIYNFHVVGNMWKSGEIVESSNYNGPVEAYEQGMGIKAGSYTMSGTSQSSAVHLGRIIANKHK